MAFLQDGRRKAVLERLRAKDKWRPAERETRSLQRSVTTLVLAAE
jgi:hypothetical protein